MALRARPDGAVAAARVAALLPVGGGWVPPEEGLDEVPPGGHDAAPVPHAEPALAGGAPEPQRHPPDLRAAVPPLDTTRSWQGRGAHSAVTRYRLDPGRRGAVALVLAAALAAVIAGGVALQRRPQEVPVPVVETAGVPLPGVSAEPPATGEVVVAVSGKVRRPGLIRLPAGSRVDDAVRAAGGAVPGVDVGVLNLARRLVDGEQVLVGVGPPPGAPAAAGGAGGLLDLNLASSSDLDALPGIGPVLAQRIVDWRTENGRFASVDQLREVTGIGEAKYEDLRAKVTV